MMESTTIRHGAIVAEQATGCLGAGGYMAYAKEHGYKFIEVIDWTSSAGDWTFIVSKDGHEWFLMSQENNYPRPGFTRVIAEDREVVDMPLHIFYGSAAEVLERIVEELYAW